MLEFSKRICSVYLFTFMKGILDSFLANVPIFYPLETPEELWFSSDFKWYGIGTLGRNGLTLKLLQGICMCVCVCVCVCVCRGGQFDPPCGFSKNASSKERMKPLVFVTFNIIISQKFY